MSFSALITTQNMSNNSNLNFAENSNEENSVHFDLDYHSDEEMIRNKNKRSISKASLYRGKVTKKKTNKSKNNELLSTFINHLNYKVLN